MLMLTLVDTGFGKRVKTNKCFSIFLRNIFFKCYKFMYGLRLLFAFGLSAKLMPKALELLFLANSDRPIIRIIPGHKY
jgi:hypothetical protein